MSDLEIIDYIDAIGQSFDKKEVKPVVVVQPYEPVKCRKAMTGQSCDGEVNDGEYIVDDTGYVPLPEMIERCKREGRIVNDTFDGDYDYDTDLETISDDEPSIPVVQSSDESGEELADRQESSKSSSNPDLSQSEQEVIPNNESDE